MNLTPPIGNKYIRKINFRLNRFIQTKKITFFFTFQGFATTFKYPFISLYIVKLSFSCTWKHSSCGPENFTRIITDYGVCYTFTPGDIYLSHTGIVCIKFCIFFFSPNSHSHRLIFGCKHLMPPKHYVYIRKSNNKKDAVIFLPRYYSAMFWNKISAEKYRRHSYRLNCWCKHLMLPKYMFTTENKR